jgi:hypothetical protein
MSLFGNMFNPPAANVNIPTMAASPTNLFGYDPSQIGPTQSNILGGIGNLGQYNIYGQNLPQAQGIGQAAISDPFAGQALGMAQGAGNLGMNAALNQYGAGGSIYGAAMDPQLQLYNRMFTQTTDAARANAEAAGLGTSPLGAGATSWAQNNFNIDWQNAQLQRMISGAGAASQLQAGAMPLYMQGGSLPYQTSQGIYGNQLGTLGTLGQMGLNAAQIPGQQLQGWQNSLAQQAGLQQQAYGQQQGQFQNQMSIANQQLNQANMAFNQQQAMGQGLGKILGGVGGFALGGIPGAMVGSNMFGGGGGGGMSGTGWGQGQGMGQFNTQPFGGWQPQMGGPTSFGLPGGWSG